MRAGGSSLPTDFTYTGQRSESSLGLLDYRARMYDPLLARFLSADTVAPEPGNPQALNRYSYCLGNPVKYKDPSGHAVDAGGADFGPIEPPPPPPVIPDAPVEGDPATPFVVGVEWLTGQGPRHHEFREGDPFTELLQEHDYIDDMRSAIAGQVREYDYRKGTGKYDLSGLQGIPKYFKDYTNILTFGHTGNLAVTFLGTYGVEYYIVHVDRENGTAEVLFHVWNSTTLASGTRPPVIGYTEFWGKHIQPAINGLVASGPMSPVTQDFWWTETIQFK